MGFYLSRHLGYFSCKKSSYEEAGKAASMAKDKKLKKYRHPNNDYYVVPVAIETFGSYGSHALDFIKDIGCKIRESTSEKRPTLYMMQAIGIAIQQGNKETMTFTIFKIHFMYILGKNSRQYAQLFSVQVFAEKITS